MKTVWTKGIVGNKREEIEREFNASALIRERLVEILQEKISSRIDRKISEDAYQNASWPYMQADSVGYIRALDEVISILKHIKSPNT